MDLDAYQQKEERYRGLLAAELGLEDVPDAVWGYVQKLGLVHEAIRGYGRAWKELVEEAKTRLRQSLEERGLVLPPGRGKGEGVRGAPQEIALEPSEVTRKRAEVFAEVSATLAANHPHVKRFRRMYLRGRLLTDDEARAFLDSRCDGPLRTTHGTKAVSRKLWKLAGKLSETYGWRQGDAVWYVLTGHSPAARPIDVRADIDQALIQSDSRRDDHTSTPLITAERGDFSRDHRPSTARITISADVSVDAGEVERVFRDAQRQILGGDARPIRPKTLEVVRFVARRMRDHPRESWEERLDAWNDSYPEWRYKDFRALRQAFERFAYREYYLPNYRRPERTPYQTYRDDWMKRRKGTS